MFTRFEEFAAAQMLGHKDSPPRSQGVLHFSQQWQRTLFGLTLAMAKDGHFEWEDFRRNLISSIGEWETANCASQPPWDYYERFLIALTRVLEKHELVSAEEMQTLMRSVSALASSVETSQ